MNVSNEELIQQLLSDDLGIRNGAWNQIYKHCYLMVKEMILKNNGTDDDASDIFQDSLLILNHNIRNGTYRHDSLLHTYIVGICKNLWLREYTRKHKQTLAEQESTLELRQNMNSLINIEVVSLLLNELGEDCRNVIVEYYYNNRTMAELKELFNVNSIQAAKNKKWRCMNNLIKLFKEKGVVPKWS